MRIHQLAATFGRLENEVLDLGPGLNIIEAPNEGGKSTWTALLRVMLYGLNTRDRSLQADKRKYLPWSGSPMEGRMALTAGNEELTVLRRTARANAPMGAFSALYTGSAEPVPWLTAASCGEALLGVPQEVYERSAFIRQSGMAVDHSEALEQRIAALITTGEEDTSYTAAAERLRRQQNRRRHNKTGLLPQLERECTELRSLLDQIAAREAEIADCRDQQARLERRQAELEGQLALHDAADRAREVRGALAARDTWEQSQKKAETLAADVQSLPSRSELEALRGTLDSLIPDEDAASDALREAEAAKAAWDAAEERLAAAPTPPADDAAPSPPRAGVLLPVLALAAGVLAAVLLSLAGSWAAGAAAGCGIVLLGILASALLTRSRRSRWEAEQALLRRRQEQEREAYTIIKRETDAARESWQRASALAEAAETRWRQGLDRAMAQVRDFQPQAVDIEDGLTAVEGALARRLAAEEAARAAETAALRWELRRGAADGEPLQGGPAERPVLSRSQLQAERTANAARLEELRRRLHTAQGQIQALGDSAQLGADLAEKEDALQLLQAEYDAIALAAQALETANLSLQKRFSPALGEKSAEIFTKLTQGKYNKVLLNKELTPSAQEEGSLLPRELFQLSQGAADQLYLAVRLAICDLVLPRDKGAPLVLDDALVTFDDDRMAAALTCLAELARERQILLFTCQRRETAFLREARVPGVTFLTL